MKFFNLHHHTQFSFLDGYGTPAQTISRLKELTYDGIALTDHGSIYSHAPFSKAFKKEEELHLVYGVEFYLVGKLNVNRTRYHITVLAKTQEGYQNILKLMAKSYEQFYYKPIITLDQLLLHSKGLIILTGCFCDSILIKNPAEDQDTFFRQVMSTFDECEWYVELQPFKDEQEKWDKVSALVRKYKVPAVVTFDSHYPRPENKATQDVMLAINTNKPLSDPDRLKMEYPLHIPSLDEVVARCKEMGKYDQSWITRTWDIGHSCQVELPKTGLVAINTPFGDFKKLCYDGLKKRGLEEKEEYKERLEREILLIKEKDFVDYFIIISDLMMWAKKKMLCGAGRGSSAGSLVCFCLEITEVDPILHGLMFERFIDVNRKDLPDIDLDFPSDKREEVIQYITDKYGKERTSQLINFNTYKPKAIIQDAGRILKIPPWEIKEATSQIIDRSGGDARANFCLRDSIEQFDKLKNLFIKYPKLYDAVDLEGQVRQVGKHAAAVVIANDPLDYIGVVNQDGVFSIDKYSAEAHGLLKIDVLGIETLSVLTDVCNAVSMDYHDLYTLALDDKKTFKDVFTPSKLIGIFQFEGLAVKSVCSQISPKTFEQLVHITALGRPGTMNSGTTPVYVKRTTGKAKFDKEEYRVFDVRDPALEKYTADTHGLILYQEQVMAVVKEIGKFSWASTSAVRVAMSKSLGEEHFNKYKEDFIKGAAEDGIDANRADRIWRQCYTHGSWSFNKSHAVSYALLSYWCGYMKAHYPAPYYARLLKGEIDDSKIKSVLKEWNKKVVPIDINQSKTFFTTDGKVLYGGFTNIKGIGVAAATKIEEGQPYENMEDFRSRMPKGVVTKIEDAIDHPPEWTLTLTLNEIYAKEIESIKMSCPLITISESEEKNYLEYAMLVKVVDVNLRNSNDPDKVAKRGHEIKGYPEYMILKVRDDNEDMAYLYFDNKFTEKNKQELLSTKNKIILVKLKKKGSFASCIKFKVLTKEEKK